VIAFGTVRIIKDAEAKRRALYGLIEKYFPDMAAGKQYRPITDKELASTSVYAISKVGAERKIGRNKRSRATSGRHWQNNGLSSGERPGEGERD
jgi:hypothetical protein